MAPLYAGAKSQLVSSLTCGGSLYLLVGSDCQAYPPRRTLGRSAILGAASLRLVQTASGEGTVCGGVHWSAARGISGPFALEKWGPNRAGFRQSYSGHFGCADGGDTSRRSVCDDHKEYFAVGPMPRCGCYSHGRHGLVRFGNSQFSRAYRNGHFRQLAGNRVYVPSGARSDDQLCPTAQSVGRSLRWGGCCRGACHHGRNPVPCNSHCEVSSGAPGSDSVCGDVCSNGASREFEYEQSYLKGGGAHQNNWHSRRYCDQT
jgi:hypothetical protein